MELIQDKYQNFTLLCNRIDSELEFPITINDEYCIDKASSDEIEIIKNKHLDKIEQSSPKDRINPFEMLELSKLAKRKNTPEYFELGNKDKRENWHYWIIRHNRHQIQWPKDVIFAIINCELIPIFDYIISSSQNDKSKYLSGSGYTGYSSNQIFDLGHTMKKVSIKADDISTLKLLLVKIDELDKESEENRFIFRNLKNYRSLLRMPIYEDLRNIGKFAIIESLLSTRKSVTLQSVSHQLRTKIPLVNNRMKEKINFKRWLKKLPAESKIEKIIDQLYTYRSCLAHGTEPNFKNKELKLLENSVWADYVVDEICRKVLIQTILEPRLIKDLRHC